MTFVKKEALLTWAKVVSKSSTPHVNGIQPKRHFAQMDAPPWWSGSTTLKSVTPFAHPCFQHMSDFHFPMSLRGHTGCDLWIFRIRKPPREASLPKSTNRHMRIWPSSCTIPRMRKRIWRPLTQRVDARCLCWIGTFWDPLC